MPHDEENPLAILFRDDPPKGAPKGCIDPVKWYFNLSMMMGLFRQGDHPDWLVDQFYHAAGDPVVRKKLDDATNTIHQLSRKG